MSKLLLIKMEPIVVIVGFLGAGKTTLLKKLTEYYLQNHWDPFVILNDYQNANIDSQYFLDLLDKEKINPLSGSCICCSGVTELRQLVNNIPERNKGITFIEANGTTDACTLMEFLGVGLRKGFTPAIQVSIIDARYWQKRGHHNDLEANQIQTSSLIILNHAIEVSIERKKDILEEIRSLNPYAIVKDWESLEIESLPELIPSANKVDTIDHLKFHWSSCSVDLPNPLSSKVLHRILEKVPPQILRIKGCTIIDEDPHYSFIERIPDGKIFIRPYYGELISGPQMVLIGPGSNPIEIEEIIKKEINFEKES